MVAVIVLGIELFVLGKLLWQLVADPHNPLFGFDFPVFWGAAQLAGGNLAADSFDPVQMGRFQTGLFDLAGAARWHYPPTMHLLLLPLTGVSFAAGLFFWTVAGLIGWAICAIKIAGHARILDAAAIIAAPAAFFNAVQGQNGVLTGLLLVLFYMALQKERRVWAGFWAAALLIKPHLGLLIPIVLILGRHWSVFGWGGMFAFLFCGAATWVFGVDYWIAFSGIGASLTDAALSGQLAMQQISGFAFAQLVGVPVAGAVIMQVATGLAAIAVTGRVWLAADAPPDLKTATAIICGMMITPYAFFYDTLAAVAAVYLLIRLGAQNGFARGERLIYLFFWLTPLIQAFLMKNGLFSVYYPAFLMLMWQCLRRLPIDRAARTLPRAAAGSA